MFKTASMIIVVILALVLFHPNLKGMIVERQVKSTTSDLKISTDTRERFQAIAERLNQGYAGRKFTDIEKDTIAELRLEMRQLRERQTEEGIDDESEGKAKLIVGKFEAILRRHQL